MDEQDEKEEIALGRTRKRRLGKMRKRILSTGKMRKRKSPVGGTMKRILSTGKIRKRRSPAGKTRKRRSPRLG